MIDELEFWGVDSSSGTANADALRQAEESEPAHLPEIVRDVHRDWQANTCCECQKSLEHETTIHLHQGNAYCSRCYHAENV